MDRKISDLYDKYLHTTMGRRNFLRQLTVLTGSATATTSVLSLLEGNQAHAVQVVEDDPRLSISTITSLLSLNG